MDDVVVSDEPKQRRGRPQVAEAVQRPPEVGQDNQLVGRRQRVALQHARTGGEVDLIATAVETGHAEQGVGLRTTIVQVRDDMEDPGALRGPFGRVLAE
jgi:hypothetical protein